MRGFLRGIIRPSTTRSTGAIYGKSLLNAALFFAIFMLALPWLAHRSLPHALPLPIVLRTWLAGALALAGVGAWIACLDTFSRRGRGTPFPLDAPRELVTQGPFSVIRNPIMAAELLVIWAEALYLASLGVTLYAVAISFLGHVAVCQIEEPELRERFGATYEAYSRNVPRWLPRVRRPQ